MGRLRRLLRKMWDAVMDAGEARVPTVSSLRSDADRMFEALGLQADATSLAMTLADEKYGQLETVVRMHEDLGRQAESFRRQGMTAEAERSIEQQLECERRIARLKGEYAPLQADAERHAESYRARKREVDARVVAIPALQDDQRLIEAQERVARAVEEHTLRNAQSSFDETAKGIEQRKRQLANRAALTADPNARIDRTIEESLKRSQIEERLAALDKKIAEGDQVIEAEFTVIPTDPLAEARQLLAAPRFMGILPEKTSEERVLVKRRNP